MISVICFVLAIVFALIGVVVLAIGLLFTAATNPNRPRKIWTGIALIVISVLLLMAGFLLDFNNFPATAPAESIPVEASWDPYSWVQADTPYTNLTKMYGGMTFKGPAVCEWWDQMGFAFKATYNVEDGVKVLELHEGMFFLLEGQSYTYPSQYVGTCWNLQSNSAIADLADSFRHLLFFSNVYGNDSNQIKALKAQDKIWSEMIVEGKGQHAYMHEWLAQYNLGVCEFNDQSGCSYLVQIVAQPPLGTSIK